MTVEQGQTQEELEDNVAKLEAELEAAVAYPAVLVDMRCRKESRRQCRNGEQCRIWTEMLVKEDEAISDLPTRRSMLKDLKRWTQTLKKWQWRDSSSKPKALSSNSRSSCPSLQECDKVSSKFQSLLGDHRQCE